MVSPILLAESQDLWNQLNDWLPRNGNWSVSWRATRDGWKSSTFHENCDGKVPTLTIVKVDQENKTSVCEGYAIVSWGGEGE